MAKKGLLSHSAHKALRLYISKIPKAEEIAGSEDPKELEKVKNEIYVYISNEIRREQKKMFTSYKNIEHFIKIIDTFESDKFKEAFQKLGILTEYKRCIQCKKYLPDDCFSTRKLACTNCRMSNEIKRRNGKKIPKHKIAPLKARKNLENFLNQSKNGIYQKGDYQLQGATIPKKNGLEVVKVKDGLILKVYIQNKTMEFDLASFTSEHIANLLWEKGIEVTL